MPLYDPFDDPGPPVKIKSVKATGLSPTFAFSAGSASVSPLLFPPGVGPAGTHVEPVPFDDLVLRIRSLTGLSPRRASLIAGEFECATRVIDPRQPSDMELVVKAKEYGYLPDEWRLP